MDLYAEMERRPNDFKVIERVPFTLLANYPVVLDCSVGDEIDILLADVETTGLEEDDGITELGLTKIKYSPSLRKITEIVASGAWFQDPLKPIPADITELTGITDDDVRGKIITIDDLQSYLDGNPIVIAHNSSFDRPKIEKFISFWPKDLRWACSASEIDWYKAGLESRKLEFVVYRLGYFYDGHRANIDTNVLCFVFFQRPDLLKLLVDGVNKRTAIIRAFGSPFEVKDTLKANGFRWDDGTVPGIKKHWNIKCAESEVESKMAFLNQFYDATNNAQIEYFDATQRFK